MGGSVWNQPDVVKSILSDPLHFRNRSVQKTWEAIRIPLPPGSDIRSSGQASSAGSGLRDPGERLRVEIRHRMRREGLVIEPRARALNRSWVDVESNLMERTVQLFQDREYLKKNNPLTRHVILRKRKTLEDMGVLKRIGVNIHPDPEVGADKYAAGGDYLSLDRSESGSALSVPQSFADAYEHAEAFCKSLGKRAKASGFIKTILTRRLCSSVRAGLTTARSILAKGEGTSEGEGSALWDEGEYLLLMEEYDGELKAGAGPRNGRKDAQGQESIFCDMSEEEKDSLRSMVRILEDLESRVEDVKLQAVKFFLGKHKVPLEDRGVKKTWAEHGCIVFSQYYDTAKWTAEAVAQDSTLRDYKIALYAGQGRSRLFENGEWKIACRAEIKAGVETGEIRLVFATDAACEGLNLQRLGCLINVDMPWNPSRLEQRIGRIRRIGQTRDSVDVCNLFYDKTVEKDVFNELSRRMKENVEILGGLPDTMWADWIEDGRKFEDEIEGHLTRVRDNASAFDLASEEDYDHDTDDWSGQAKVIRPEDIQAVLKTPW